MIFVESRKGQEVLKLKISIIEFFFLHSQGGIASGCNQSNTKFYSIAEGKGSVKVYILGLSNQATYIDEIRINFVHDSREQVEDAMKLRRQDHNVNPPGSPSLKLIIMYATKPPTVINANVLGASTFQTDILATYFSMFSKLDE